MKTKLFCNYCGGSLGTGFHEGKRRQVCEQCGEVYYENPLPAVSVIVANEHRELLLVKRAREPAKGMWCFPIGFAETGEAIEQAAVRELKEEAGIDGRIVRLVDVCSEYNDVYGDVLVISYEAERTGGRETAGDDAVDCGYFPLTGLPELAFGSQKRALRILVDLKRQTWKITEEARGLIFKALGFD